MLVIGIACLVLGFVLSVHILWIIGIILTVVGAALLLAGSIGHPVGGRRHYW